ncbi:MAG: alpha/beta hydrolase [Steroidobacteraceae bacterium]
MILPPLVLVPGLLCDDAVWEAQRVAFADRTTVLIPRHGDADSLGLMAAQTLAAAPPRFALVGHSMGGRVALEILARAPERVERLALLDTGFEGLSPGEAGDAERAGRMKLLAIAREQGMRAMGTEWAKGMVHPQRLVDAPLMDAILGMIERATPDVFAAQINALLNRPDRTSLLAGIRVPTLVLCGHDDAWSNLARHRVLARHIPGSELVDIPECGHMSTMERPAELNQALLAWLTDAPQPHAVSKNQGE